LEATSETGALDVWFFVRSSLERWRAEPRASARVERPNARSGPAPRRRGALFVVGTVRPDPEAGARLGFEMSPADRLRLQAEVGYGYADRPAGVDRHRVPLVLRAAWALARAEGIEVQIGAHQRTDGVIARRDGASAFDVSLGIGLGTAIHVFPRARGLFLRGHVAGTGYIRRQRFETERSSDREPAGVFEAGLGLGWAP